MTRNIAVVVSVSLKYKSGMTKELVERFGEAKTSEERTIVDKVIEFRYENTGDIRSRICRIFSNATGGMIFFLKQFGCT